QRRSAGWWWRWRPRWWRWSWRRRAAMIVRRYALAISRLFLIGATCIAACAALPVVPRAEAARIAQESFASADEAAKALADAARAKSSRELTEVLGPAAANVLSSGDRYA